MIDDILYFIFRIPVLYMSLLVGLDLYVFVFNILYYLLLGFFFQLFLFIYILLLKMAFYFIHSYFVAWTFFVLNLVYCILRLRFDNFLFEILHHSFTELTELMRKLVYLFIQFLHQALALLLL